jgi:hypothetical protein
VNIERRIFKFLWSTKDNPEGIDRIKRSIMKNEYADGGMRVTDVECLDKSLKLKQFIRAKSTNHEIAKIQNLLTNGNSNVHLTRQEYYLVTNGDPICKSAQGTLNIITDYNREQYKHLPHVNYEGDRNLINEVASINLKTYLKRKNRVFALCILKQLNNLGITTLGELVQSYEHETNENLNKIMLIIIKFFPKSLVDIAKAFNEEINEINPETNYILISGGRRMIVETITAKDFQLTLKHALGRLEERNFAQKLDVEEFDTNNIDTFRKHCKNIKLRKIYFRLIHNDFFRCKSFVGVSAFNDC